jgi:hypothetical protein
VVVIGTDGGVSISYDGGNNWSNINGNLANSQVFSIDIHEGSQAVIGGFMDNASMGLFGGSWQTNIYGSDGDGTVSYIHPQSETKAIVGDPQGNDFNYSPGWVPPINNMDDLNKKDTYLGMPMESSLSAPDIIYYGLRKHGEVNPPTAKVVRYDTSIPTDAPTWCLLDPDNTPPNYVSNVTSIAVNESDPNRVLVSTEGVFGYNFWVSTDGGANFFSTINSSTQVQPNVGASYPTTPMLSVLPYRNIRDIAISSSDYNKVWIAMGGVVQSDVPGEVHHERWRVIKSVNGGDGPNWYDYSEGLPGLPVNTILYVDGYNDLLFVGTDAGVYYRNADMEQWECFNNGFPLAIVTDLEFDYCHKTLYASTFGRSIYKVEIPFDLGGTDPNSAEMVIGADTDWNTDMSIRQTVRVESGNTLTVTATIDMLTDKKIIVEQGATLKIQGGTLTNLCDGFWGGIEVWGTASEDQFGNAQGEVIISGNAVIEHAQVAVALWKPDDWSTTGGIIIAHNSIFRNNKKDVEFLRYSNDESDGTHHPNKGLFVGCSFLWDDDFRTDIPLAHVTLYRVDGVRFSGCTFMDGRTAGTFPLVFNNVGIKSIDAKYSVSGTCPTLGGCTGDVGEPGSTWQPTVFENLYFGIYATNMHTAYAINVDRCHFIDNGYGVLISAMPSPVIVRSKFEFTNDGTHAFVPFTMHGLHAVNCKMMTVEENRFIDEASGQHKTFGVVSSDLGEQDEVIYRNSFTGLTFANFAQGNNGNGSASDPFGLWFPCNDNVLNNFDHYVVNTLWGVTGSNYDVRLVSGSSDLSTGTSFSNDPGDLIHNEDYKNLSTDIIYYWYQPDQEPDDYGAFTVDILNDLGTQENPCDPTISNYHDFVGKLSEPDKAEFIAGFYSTSSALESKRQEYQDNLLNSTETQAILLAVDNLEPNNKQSVRTMLDSYSPYLTTEILFEVADNTPSDFNHPWLRDLLLANIEAVTPELILFLETKDYPLPAPMRQTVANAIGTTHTQRRVLESEIGQLSADRAFYSYQLIRGIEHDSDEVDTDSLRYWLIEQNNILHQQLIIDSYMQDGNFDQAEIETDNLAAMAAVLPAHLRSEVTDFVSLKRKLLEILQNPERIAQLPLAELAFLRNLATRGNGTARYQAQNILCFFYNECDYYSFETEEDSRAPETQITIESDEEQPTFSVYPNPASGWVMIELSLESFMDLENAEIIVTDLTGKVVKQTSLTRSTYLWETGSVENGVYLIIIKSNNVLFDAQKVIITH